MRKHKNTFFRKKQMSFLKEAINKKNIFLISAESGVGKTTLITDFLQRENKSFLYVEITESMQDIGGLIDKINSSILRIFGKCKLPSLDFELLIAIDLFIRNYIKELFRFLPEDFFLVFDNFEKIGNKEIINFFFIQLIKEIPKDRFLVILSKEELPFGFLNWKDEEKILRLDTSFFRLTKEEIKHFINQKEGKDLSIEELESIYESTNGVIGRLLLVNETFFENICENLSAKILKYISKNDLELLLKVSYLPVVNGEILSSYKDRERILSIIETLYIENFFIRRDENGYKIHDILKEFLRLKGKESNIFHEIVFQQVYALVDNGFIDEAIKILINEEKIETAISILEKSIFYYIQKGKFYTLRNYISLFEKKGYKLSPTLLFAKGYLLKIDNPYEAVKVLEKSLTAFRKQKNLQGEKLAIGELFDLVQFYGEDFKIGGKYLKRAEKLLENTESFSEVDIRLLSYSGIISLLFKGDSGRSEFYFDKINELINNTKDLPIFFSYVKLYAAISYLSAGEVQKAKKNFHEACFIFDSNFPNPSDVFMFQFLASIYEVFIGDFEKSAGRGLFLLEYIEKWGQILHKEHIISRILEGLLCAGNIDLAKKYINEIESLKFRTTFSTATTYQLEAQMYLIEGKYDLSIEKAKKSIQLFKKINGKPFEIATKSLLSLAYIEKKEFRKAKDILLHILRWAKGKKAILQMFTTLIHLTYLYYRSKEKIKLQKTLTKAFKLGREREIFAIYNQYPSLISIIVALALKYRIEEEYAKEWIRKYDLEPPEDSDISEYWDWKVKIYTFGDFKIVVNGKKILEKDINGSKPIELLKAILVQKGESISIYRLIDLLWDEYDFIKAKQNLEFNLRKLRSILNDNKKNLVILKNNKIILNKKYIWTDLWKFEEIYSKLLSDFYKNRINKEKFHLEIEKLKSLYTGRFLEGDYDLWIEDFREDIDRKYKYIQTLLA